MNFTERRKQVFDKMDQDSALLLFSGIELHVSADEYLPFEANRNFLGCFIDEWMIGTIGTG